jgi:hypothetical protein
VIKSFKHKGLEHFYRTGKTAGIQPKHKNRLRMQLAALLGGGAGVKCHHQSDLANDAMPSSIPFLISGTSVGRLASVAWTVPFTTV